MPHWIKLLASFIGGAITPLVATDDYHNPKPWLIAIGAGLGAAGLYNSKPKVDEEKP